MHTQCFSCYVGLLLLFELFFGAHRKSYFRVIWIKFGFSFLRYQFRLNVAWNRGKTLLPVYLGQTVTVIPPFLVATVSLVSPLQPLFLCLFCEGSEGWFLLDPNILLIHWRHAFKFRARGLLSGRDNRVYVAALMQECRHLLVLTWPPFSMVRDICAEMFPPDFAKFSFVIRMCSSLASLITPY